MALRIGPARIFHQKCDFLLRNGILATNSFNHTQSRYVQSKRDMRKDSQVFRPWHKWVEKFENGFQRKYPRIYRVYALFKLGTKDFISDTKKFYHVTKGIRQGEPLHKYSRSDLELLLKLPPQAVKVLPIIIISILPFGLNLVIPLAYFFPRQLLCRHYWTPEQRIEFASLDVKRRLRYYDGVLQYLDQSSDRLNDKERAAVTTLVKKLNSRSVPAVDDVVDAKPAFNHNALRLSSIPWANLVNLSRSMNLSLWRGRAQNSCAILLAADRALSKESVDLLTETELREACATRGLNPAGLGKKEMTTYLKTWLSISLKLKESDASLLLHTATILSRNHPNNVKLRA